MRAKKSKFNLLERRRVLFLEIGFIVALAAVLTAFSYRTYQRTITLDPGPGTEFTDELPPVTKQPEMPKPKPVQPVTVINIIDDNTPEPGPIDIDVETSQAEPAPEWQPVVKPEENVDERNPFVPIEIEPEFPGGDAALLGFLHRHLKYPLLARNIGIEGTVYVSFVIMPDGSVSDIKLVRGIGGGCDEEALRVIGMMPDWKPGIQAGRKVPAGRIVPIKFELKD